MCIHTRRFYELPQKRELRPLRSGEQEILETFAFFGNARSWIEKARELTTRVELYLNGAGIPIATTILMLAVILIFHFLA